MKMNEENQVWDPVKADRQARLSNLRLIAVILVIIALGGAWILGSAEYKKRTGEVELNAFMTFEEADKQLLEAGYYPMGESYRGRNRVIRTYEGRKVFGLMPVYSALETEEGNGRRLRLSHLFEESGRHAMADQGEICRQLKKELTRRYGTPEEKNDVEGKYWQWNRGDHGLVMLGYMMESMPVLCYVWTDSGPAGLT